MTNQTYNYMQKNLIDLKIKQAKAELELNFSILTFENMQKMKYIDNKYRSSAFLQAYFILKNNQLFQFIEKVNSDNIDKISYNIKDEAIAKFLRSIEYLTKLDEEELVDENNKIRKNIRKLEEAVAELEEMMLESLPKNHYSS